MSFDLVLWFRMLQLQVDSYVTQPYTAPDAVLPQKVSTHQQLPLHQSLPVQGSKTQHNEPSHNQPTAERHSSSRRAWADKAANAARDITQVWYVGEREASPPAQSQDLPSLLGHSPPMPGSLGMSRKQDDSTCILSRSRDGMQPLPRVNSLRKMWPSVKWVQDLGA